MWFSNILKGLAPGPLSIVLNRLLSPSLMVPVEQSTHCVCLSLVSGQQVVNRMTVDLCSVCLLTLTLSRSSLKVKVIVQSSVFGCGCWMKQVMMEWQCHQLDHMQIICTLLQTDDNTHNFLQAGCSSWHPTNSVKVLAAVWYPVYTVQPVWQPAISCKQTSNGRYCCLTSFFHLSIHALIAKI